MTYLPCFDHDAHARSQKDHPARIVVVINKIEQNDRLHKDIGDDLGYG